MREKPRFVNIEEKRFERIWVKTHIITEADNILDVLRKYVLGLLKPNDIITIAESTVAITQGRAIPITKIQPRLLAKILYRFVRKVPYGIGLRSPFSMECAIREVGSARILVAALISGLMKVFIPKRRGDFYRIAGKQAAMIDAPHTSGVKEFYECVIMGPKEPDFVAQRLSDELKTPVAIVDANDISGCWVVGASKNLDIRLVERLMADNPAGQGDALTPIIILRSE